MKRFVLAAFIAATFVFTTERHSSAQDFKTGYFLDGYVYRYRINPAFQNETGYIGITPFSNLGINVESNAKISSEDFLSGLADQNHLGINLDMNLLSVGFRTKSLYHTIDITSRSNISASAPYDLLRFMKDGTSDAASFDFSNTDIFADSYLQLAYGISKNFADKLYVGLRVKALTGLFNANIHYDRATMVLSNDQWTMTADGSMTISAGNIEYSTMQSEYNPEMECIDFDSVSCDFTPKSFGFGMDLGAVWKALPFLTVSASVLDIGAMSWKNCVRGHTSGQSVEYYPDENLDGGDDSDAQLEDALDNLQSLFEFIPDPSVDIVDKMPMSVNLGAEFFIPNYKALSFGLLYSWKNNSIYNSHNVRLSANWAACKWLALSVSGSKGSFGWTGGAALNIHTRGFKFFVGADCLPLSFRTQPTFAGRLSSNVRFGINCGFGKRHDVK